MCLKTTMRWLGAKEIDMDVPAHECQYAAILGTDAEERYQTILSTQSSD
jgi:hypothetical protein